LIEGAFDQGQGFLKGNELRFFFARDQPLDEKPVFAEEDQQLIRIGCLGNLDPGREVFEGIPEIGMFLDDIVPTFEHVGIKAGAFLLFRVIVGCGYRALKRLALHRC